MFQNVTLEVSLKPFKRTDSEYISEVCRGIFDQWRALLRDRKEISIMMWTADGSQILDYASDLDDEFEWCCYIGNANKPLIEPDDFPGVSLHRKKHYYMHNPPKMTYRILKEIVAAFKTEGKKAFPNATITIGETMDIGPEFAVSDFKYNRHPEVCPRSEYVGGMVDSASFINADTRKYAAYPDGIPDHTPFGLFLGKQTNEYLTDIGFDFIWLSNGMGFSVNPWSQDGKIYDGENFHAEKLDNVKKGVVEFWKNFRDGCPDFPVRTRGTNNSVGIDYATDGVPLYDIYNAGYNITPPPNSPWAALNDDFGLEIMGHMSRICNLPGDELMFRYYIHDPWWLNSPWYDRYNGQPHDIYLPMAISRIDAKGAMQSANMFSILSIDNSYGEMPDACVNEPIPHILLAEKHSSDAPAPFVWLYPMREFTCSESNDELRSMYFGDKYICNAINAGFPLNCVVSTDNFKLHSLDLYMASIIVAPVMKDQAITDKLCSFVKSGGRVIVYSDQSGADYAKANGFAFVDIDGSADAMLQKVKEFGYIIDHLKLDEGTKPPTMTINRHNNGMFFSVYNCNTTTTTKLKFPLGAPILMCGETVIKDGYSNYTFSRAEHRECRIFVDQKSGVISAREATPSCMNHRRRIMVTGLEDATVCFFSEEYSKECATVGMVPQTYDRTPYLDDRFKLVHDPLNGTYIKGEHITGGIFCFMPNERGL